MLPDHLSLDLRELAAKRSVGVRIVSVRIVRVYQAQGLIAAPGQRGPALGMVAATSIGFASL